MVIELVLLELGQGDSLQQQHWLKGLHLTAEVGHEARNKATEKNGVGESNHPVG